AYYVLIELANIKPGESVLIHNGCSSFGQAAITLAHKHKCIVYTTVASEKQKFTLFEQMQMFSPHQILDYTDSTFDYKLMMATHGLGVNVIINSLAESQLQASMRCLSTLGRIIQIEVSERDEQNTIGLRLFLTIVRLHGVIPRNIFNWS
ncbi:Fatty acid synthase 2, partial [Carabus blaptoides fortunei]